MDFRPVKLEPDIEDIDYSNNPSYQYIGSLGCSDNGDKSALATVKLEQDIADNLDDENANMEANRAALERTRSLAFGSFIYDSKKEQGKDSGTDILVSYHNSRLRGILAELISQHRWEESAGVLSVLLKGSVRDIYYFRQQSKYWAALEILRQVEGIQGNETRCKRVFGLLKNKQPAPKKAINKKLRPAVELQYALYLISQGDLDVAREISKALVQEKQFRDDPVANLIHGLILYQKWFDDVSQDLHLEELGMSDLAEEMEIDSLGISSKSYNLFHNSRLNMSSAKSREINVCTLDSDSSIGNEKEIRNESRYYSLRKQFPIRPTYNAVNNCVEGFDKDTDEEVSSYVSGGVISEASTVLSSQDLDRILFPIRLPITQEPLKYMIPTERSNARTFRLDALKHFKVALSSSPPLLAAFIPYLQLLLSNGQVKETWKEIEKLCCNSNHILPFSMKARLAESLTPKQPGLLASCYEKVLCKNPASSRSVKHLVKLRNKGYYQTESLVEYIALHLDADFGCTDIWREFASCFIEIQAKWQAEHENDQLSTEEHGNYSDRKRKFLRSSDQFPTMFLKSTIRSNWKLRCKWWAGRHFNRETIYSELQEIGNWEHITLKAACASHILGPTFLYVTDIFAALERLEEKDMLSLLKSHIQCSLRLREHLLRA